MRVILLLLIFISTNSYSQISFSKLLAKKYCLVTEKASPHQIDSLFQLYPEDDTLSIVNWHVDTSYTVDTVYHLLYDMVSRDRSDLAYWSLAQDYWNDQETDSAKKWNDKYLINHPKNEDALTLKAWIYYTKKKFPRAIALLNQIEKTHDKSPKRTALKGHSYFEMKNTSRASLLFDEALREDSSCYTALQGAFNIYQEVKAYPQIIEIGNRLIKIDSLNIYYLNTLANAYQELKQYKKSIQFFNLVHTLAPEELSAIERLANLYHTVENMDSLCKYHNLLINAEVKSEEHKAYNEQRRIQYKGYCTPNTAEYHYQRGIAAYNLGQFENAIDYYNTGLKKFPNDFYTCNFKGNAYMALKKYKEAISAYDKGIDILRKGNYKISGTPEHMKNGDLNFIAVTYYSAAECYANLFQNNKCEEYINEFESHFGQGPKETLGSKYTALAIMAFNNNNYTEGFEYLEKRYSNSKLNRNDYQIGLLLAASIYEINSNTPQRIYNLGVRVNDKHNPLIQRKGVYQLKKELNPVVKMDRAYQIINELKMKYPTQGEAYIIEAFFNKELGKPYCDNIKALNTLGFPILNDPYWEHCK